MQEVDRQPVDGSAELRDAVQALLGRAPVVLVAPVPAQLSDDVQRHPLRPVRHRLLLGPARPGQAQPQVVDVGLRNADPEHFDCVEQFADLLSAVQAGAGAA